MQMNDPVEFATKEIPTNSKKKNNKNCVSNIHRTQWEVNYMAKRQDTKKANRNFK